jgi:glycosyltransferase involved in cell wall biosynthesis
MITYKHEAFIAKAIEGVLMQEVVAPIELIIADDCSPDRTPDIVGHYVKNHPRGQWLRYHRHESNRGMSPNLVWALERATGKYVALCDGDDYWTDPLKLGRQVGFLEDNRSFSICAHAVDVRDEHGAYVRTFSKPGEYDRLGLLEDYSISTLSVLFRNHVCDYTIPDGVFSADLFLFMKLLKDHKAWVMPDVMGVHVEHDGGVWSRRSAVGKLECALSTYRVLRDGMALDGEVRALVVRRIEEFETWLEFNRAPIGGVLRGRIPLSFFIENEVSIIKGKLMKVRERLGRRE